MRWNNHRSTSGLKSNPNIKLYGDLSSGPLPPQLQLKVLHTYQLQLGRQRQVWFIALADERRVYNCEIPRERVPYLSALEVWSRQGAIQIQVYLTFTLPSTIWSTKETFHRPRQSKLVKCHINPCDLETIASDRLVWKTVCDTGLTTGPQCLRNDELLVIRLQHSQGQVLCVLSKAESTHLSSSCSHLRSHQFKSSNTQQ